MNDMKDIIFHAGDYVETVRGEIGYIHTVTYKK